MKINLPIESKVQAVEIVPEETLQNKLPEMIQSLEGLTKLEKQLEKQFPHEKLVQYIKDLCEAEDIRMDKFGDEYKTPNWEARKNGLDRVLELLRYRKKVADPGASSPSPVRLIFNVVNPNIEVKKKD